MDGREFRWIETQNQLKAYCARESIEFRIRRNHRSHSVQQTDCCGDRGKKTVGIQLRPVIHGSLLCEQQMNLRAREKETESSHTFTSTIGSASASQSTFGIQWNANTSITITFSSICPELAVFRKPIVSTVLQAFGRGQITIAIFREFAQSPMSMCTCMVNGHQPEHVYGLRPCPIKRQADFLARKSLRCIWKCFVFGMVRTKLREKDGRRNVTLKQQIVTLWKKASF